MGSRSAITPSLEQSAVRVLTALCIAGSSLCSAFAGETRPIDWSGAYIGGHVGYTRGQADGVLYALGPTGTANSFGSLYGGFHLGYNYVAPSRLMFGFEGDIAFPNFLEDGVITTQPTAAGTALTAKIDYVATLRARFGRAFNHWLIYATGGLAWSRARFLENPGLVVDEDKVLHSQAGWSLGMGAEIAFAPNWTARIEYLYDRFGSFAAALPSGTRYESAFDLQTLRLGISRQL